MTEVRYNAQGIPINGKDLDMQITNKVREMRLRGIDTTKEKLCNSAGITYEAVLLASRRNTMRIKSINKLKKVGIIVKFN